MIQIAAFWKRQSKNDRTYYQGKLGNGKLLLFKNDKKETEKQPDLILCVVQDTTAKRDEHEREYEDDDLPF